MPDDGPTVIVPSEEATQAQATEPPADTERIPVVHPAAETMPAAIPPVTPMSERSKIQSQERLASLVQSVEQEALAAGVPSPPIQTQSQPQPLVVQAPTATQPVVQVPAGVQQSVAQSSRAAKPSLAQSVVQSVTQSMPAIVTNGTGSGLKPVVMTGVIPAVVLEGGMRPVMPQEVRDRLLSLERAEGSVAVVGSMNADYTVTARRLPEPGETVRGGALRILPGGKGANQASAAARLGANVCIYGAVGNDPNADFLLGELDAAGVDTSEILRAEGATGTTVITVDVDGENTIVYSPGANGKVSAGYVQSHRDALADASVLGLCLESPMTTVIAAAEAAHADGVTVLLNESPFLPELPHELVTSTDILLVNEHEAAQLLELDEPDGGDWSGCDWDDVVSRIADYGFERAIVTLGDQGSVVIENYRWYRVDVAKVPAKDTTGCGDAFMGTVLSGLAAGYSLLESAQMASYVAGYAATRLGAQASFGSAADVVAYFSAR
ncbi:PfkB domain-containing protein [Bifidobacterium parmae]|uniref:Ribokinase n=2 Tax=Bifidobacterium parmae TaxID=361854 RepID=A0A2N5IYV8_9BIFI|nr:PfkB domain-containing protein [Bifidobacterium parmae]